MAEVYDAPDYEKTYDGTGDIFYENTKNANFTITPP